MRPLLLALLAGCTSPVGLEVERERVPMDPPAEYEVWYAEVEACLSLRRGFDRIHWYVVEELRLAGVRYGGWLQFPDDITMDFYHQGHERSVKHEMAHHITQVGDALHYGPDARVPCDE